MLENQSEIPSPGQRAGRASATARVEFRDLRFQAAGALGEVYTGRDAELNREVAIKFIRPERADDSDSRRRFLQEAEVTGRLEHPGVVPIYALGAEPGGSPCYAMRFIRGWTLQDAIDAFYTAEKAGRDPSERSLALRELLTRFVSICETMGYGHSRGIIHRDLKPGNVMVGKFDETLVVDWGLAKPFDRGTAAHPAGEEVLTPLSGTVEGGSGMGTVGTVGTLSYMSPEQAEGRWEDVGSASDNFALGAILYAMLRGRAPYRGRSIDEILEKVRRCEFAPPRRIKHSIPRPLEAICLKAMAKRPEDRYPTAPDLAADVRRWLADEPVAAYPEPFVARIRRWTRRHRAMVISALAVLGFGLVGLAGFATILAGKNRELDRERQRAERREELAVEAVRKFRDAVQSNAELKNRPDLGGLRKVLLREPLDFFRQLKDELQSDRNTRPEALAKLAGASRDLAITTEEIGSLPDAIRSFSESIDILERLARARARDRPDSVADRRALAASLHGLGRLLAETARPGEALASYRRALEIRDRLARDNPGDTGDQARLAGIHSSIGLLLQETGRPAEAMESHRRGLAIRERLVAEHPEFAAYQTALAGSHNNIGLLFRETGRRREALESYRRAQQVQERLAREYPDVAQYRNDLAGSFHNIGLLLSELDRTEEALESLRQGLRIREQLALESPSVTEYQSDLGHGLNGTGFMLAALGREDEALAMHRRALAIRERLVADNPTVTEHRSDLARSLANIGSLLRERGRLAEAMATFARERATLEPLVRENPAVHAYHHALGSALDDLADVEMDLGHWDRARDLTLEAAASLRRALAGMPDNPKYLRLQRLVLGKLPRVYTALDQPAEATRAARELVSLARSDP